MDIGDWLDKIKPGLSRYRAAFVDVGADDENDLADVARDAEARRFLDAKLDGLEVRPLDYKKLTRELDAIGRPDDSSASAPPAPAPAPAVPVTPPSGCRVAGGGGRRDPEMEKVLRDLGLEEHFAKLNEEQVDVDSILSEDWTPGSWKAVGVSVGAGVKIRGHARRLRAARIRDARDRPRVGARAAARA